ncbi:uncharacterized protein LOC108149575 [Drosophila elegans]|uniref:uncharacterized protein LOC108149575 n=1 Tax=Drosophila elegans TaxID=30023 RepID=UPI001BC84D53|nr:uncharacterized protein LOC108149575 [Drosophila elegans]
MLKLDTNGGIICTGFLSIAFAITYLALMDDYFWRNGLYELGIHISSLQILGSVCLLIGAFKQKYKFLVPWMITTGFFMYLMVYASITTLTRLGDWIFIPTMLLPFTVYLGCALYSVQKAFDRMRKDMPPSYSNLSAEKDIIHHI